MGRLSNLFRTFTKKNKGFPKAKNTIIDFNNWTSFQNQSSYLKGYFEFPEYNPKTDSYAKRIRSLLLLSIVDGIMSSDNIANFAECGCYKGHSSFAISKILQKNNFEQKFYIFDSFEGLSEPTDNDILDSDGKSVRQELKSMLLGDNLKFIGDYELYKKLMSDFNFIDIKKGWIPERFSEVQDSRFSFVHIDVDIYEPTLDSLKFFYKRLINGGVIVIDDYSRPYWPGCDRAVNEFIRSISEDSDYRFFEVPLGGAVLTKIC